MAFFTDDSFLPTSEQQEEFEHEATVDQVLAKSLQELALEEDILLKQAIIQSNFSATKQLADATKDQTQEEEGQEEDADYWIDSDYDEEDFNAEEDETDEEGQC
ncbi:hypothetical protein [Mollivirus kamchatka]|nr:hypothetical protein [Mollivirus kamchatka]